MFHCPFQGTAGERTKRSSLQLTANCIAVWYFWDYDVIYSNSQPRLGTGKINGCRKFSEIKVQKTWVLMFVIAWNLARSFWKTYCVQKCKNIGYREFDFSGTLRISLFFPDIADPKSRRGEEFLNFFSVNSHLVETPGQRNTFWLIRSNKILSRENDTDAAASASDDLLICLLPGHFEGLKRFNLKPVF